MENVKKVKSTHAVRLLDYINAMAPLERERFAGRCGTTVGYLRRAISTGQQLGEALSVRLETHTQDVVTLRELRPEFAEELERGGYLRVSSAIRAYLNKAEA
jgi:hypothetical protein